MKKSLIALAVMAAAGAASAQSSVTLFGIVDATFNHASSGGPGGSHVNQLSNSGYNSSRLGFRGTEDLGGGLSASFWLEAGVNNDNGTGAATNTNNQLTGAAPAGVAGAQGLTFNRRSTVSLAGGWGELRLGRDYTPAFWNLTIFDPFGTNGVGTTQGLNGLGLGPVAGTGVASGANGSSAVTVRASNGIGYFAPANLGGFYGQANYYMGENNSSTGAIHNDGNGWGLRVGYAAGPFNVAGAFERTKYAQGAGNTGGDFRTWNLGGQWDFGIARIMAQFGKDRREAVIAQDGRQFLLGFSVPVGPGEIRGSWSRYKLDTNGILPTEPRSDKFALGYVHNLSKRTALYATVARLRNRDGANMAFAAPFGAGVVNANATGWDLGIRHSF